MFKIWLLIGYLSVGSGYETITPMVFTNKMDCERVGLVYDNMTDGGYDTFSCIRLDNPVYVF